MPEENIKSADLYAENYDEAVVKTFWPGPEILYNLSKEYLKKETTLLDLGIGTGAASEPFQKSGVQITGIDGSKNMLGICRNKNIASRLVEQNLESTPYPFENHEFSFVLSHAVFHLVHPIEPIFAEVSRILKPGGIFCFTFDETSQKEGYTEFEPGIWRTVTATGVYVSKHEKSYILNLLRLNGFTLLNETRYLAFSNHELKMDFYFMAFLAIKNQ